MNPRRAASLGSLINGRLLFDQKFLNNHLFRRAFQINVPFLEDPRRK